MNTSLITPTMPFIDKTQAFFDLINQNMDTLMYLTKITAGGVLLFFLSAFLTVVIAYVAFKLTLNCIVSVFTTVKRIYLIFAPSKENEKIDN